MPPPQASFGGGAGAGDTIHFLLHPRDEPFGLPQANVSLGAIV